MTEVDSDEDLTKELQPLAYHVSDRKRVLREALKALKGKRLEAMIPPVLKVWNRPKLESACLVILEDLDDETLLSILDGRAATAGVAAVEQGPSPAKATKSKKKLKKVQDDGDEDASDVEEEPKKKKKKKISAVEDAAKLKKKKKLAKAKTKEKLKKKKKAAAAAANNAAEEAAEAAPAPHKSLMELLELEYRAKAIKALLRSQGQSVPDIPINIDGEDSEKGEASQEASQEAMQTDKTEAEAKVNGAPKKAATISKVPPSTKVTPVKTKSPVKGIEKASTVSPTKVVTKPTLKATVLTKATVKKAEKTQPQSQNEATSSTSVKKKPKGAVIDLIDAALNTSFNQADTDALSQNNPEPLPTSSVIADACASKGNDSAESLRLKLLQKYQNNQPKKELESPKPVPRKKKKKKKPVEEVKEMEEDDILDLHPQELSLTDDERGHSQNTETDNETSEYETEEDEDAGKQGEEESKDEVPITSPDAMEASQESNSTSNKIKAIINDEGKDKLLYDDEEASEDDKQDEDEKVIQEDTNASDKDEEVEDKLWQEVQADITDEVSKDDDATSDVETSAQGEPCEVEQTPIEKDEPISDNSRSGMFSETARDDMFETFANSKSTGGATTFASSLKRKITLRIDPARIGVLAAEAVEEETRKQDEIKRQEEEQRKREEEERLANEIEVEEGEIDSNEASADDEAAENTTKPPSLPDNDLRTKLNRKREAELDRKRNSSPQPSHSEDSNASDESTSYYSRRREPCRKRTPSPKRDFKKYSPKRLGSSSQENKKVSSPSPRNKRAASPVEFITQFSDMEPISDDSDNSRPSSPKRKQIPVEPKPADVQLDKDAPVHGCVERPKAPVPAESSDSDEDEHVPAPDKNEDASNEPTRVEKESEESEDEDELPKPVTWYERWAESHGMKKVAQTNKIHKKVRSKLKQVKSSKQAKPEEPKPPEPSIEAEPIIGSIEEYEKLFGKKVVVASESSNSNDVDKDDEKEDQEDEEDGDDDLWGDILGGS